MPLMATFDPSVSFADSSPSEALGVDSSGLFWLLCTLSFTESGL